MKPNYEALERQLLDAQTFAAEVRKALGMSEFAPDNLVLDEIDGLVSIYTLVEGRLAHSPPVFHLGMDGRP